MKPVDKILITGASGFIGGFLVEEALKRGYEVWAGVRSHSSRRHLQDERIRFIELDYAHEKELDDQLKAFAQENGGWRYVIHNAGLTKTTDKALFYEVNAENTRRFMEGLARHCPPEKFLLMSSLSSYGIGDETGFTPIKLTDPPGRKRLFPGDQKYSARTGSGSWEDPTTNYFYLCKRSGSGGIVCS